MSAWNLISICFLLVQFLMEAVIAVLVGMLGVLPAGLFALFVVILALGFAVPALLLWKRVAKREKDKISVRRIVGWIISGVVIVICAIGIFALAKVYSTMGSVSGNNTVNAVIGVYVLKDDPAQDIDDAGDYMFGLTEAYDAENTQKTVADLEKKFGHELKSENYETVFAMVDALYSGDVGAIILNSSYINILEGMEQYQDFSEKTKVLHDNVVSVPGDDEDKVNVRPQSAKDPFVIYLSGSDTRSDMLTTSLSDVNILAVVNPQTAQILLVNTPRDYYIENPAGNGALDKLTHCGAYGVDNSVEALSQLYDVYIPYNAQINFSGFKTLIDAIGGITVYSDVAFTTSDGFYIQAGENTLYGEAALSFARERYSLAGGDNDRGKNQMKVISAVVSKLSSGTTILSNYSQIMDSMEGMFSTNMTTEEIMRLVRMQLSEMPQWNMNSYAVTGDNGYATTYSAPGVEVYVMIPHEDAVSKAADLIDRVLDGEILTAEDLK